MEDKVKKLSELEDLKWDMEALVRRVNEKTRQIKYMDTPSNIYMKVESWAEENGIDSDDMEWKVKEVREKVNALESAIYELVEPFEDKLRSIENEHDELEMDIEDEKYEMSA
tara:strand:+ start:1395 stop:1730 length:336 start_codon:yes stop_codon:yes gene_type:complete